jgi:hypothetical protein
MSSNDENGMHVLHEGLRHQKKMRRVAVAERSYSGLDDHYDCFGVWMEIQYMQ